MNEPHLIDNSGLDRQHSTESRFQQASLDFFFVYSLFELTLLLMRYDTMATSRFLFFSSAVFPRVAIGKIPRVY